MAVDVKTVPTDRFQMRYIRFGTSGAQPLVILPGLSVKNVTDSADALAAAYRIFDGAFDVYVIDRRDDVPPVYPIEAMAADTAAALDVLGLRTVDLFGVSQGGMIAMTLALQRSDLVRRLVLGSTAAAVYGQGETVIRAWISLAEAGDAAALFDAFAAAVYSPAFYTQYREAFQRLSLTVTAQELARFAVLARGALGFNVTETLPAVRCPALVLGAAQDSIFGAEPSKTLAKLLGAQLFIYENYGHAAYDEAPDYRARVKAFLQSEAVL